MPTPANNTMKGAKMKKKTRKTNRAANASARRRNNTLRQQERVRNEVRIADEMATEMERQAADLRKRADAMLAEAARLRDDDDLGGLVSSMRMMGR